MVRDNDTEYPDVKMSNPEQVADLVSQRIGLADREHFVILALNTRNQITGINTVSVGSLDTSIVHPREVFKFAILSNASSIILAHNHPSGDISPSSDDIELTKRLQKAGEVAIEVIDHIIIGHDNNYLSFRSKGIIDYEGKH